VVEELQDGEERDGVIRLVITTRSLATAVPR
jgi:hypothetical protein